MLAFVDEVVVEGEERFVKWEGRENGKMEVLVRRSNQTRSDASHLRVIAESREVRKESVVTLID